MPPVSSSTCEVVVPVEDLSDVVIAQRHARLLAEEHGFTREVAFAIATAISEACTNIVKYGPTGNVRMGVRPGPPVCFEFVATDRGKGIGNVALARQDGISEGRNLFSEEEVAQRHRGLGCGLGAIERLMDRVSIRSSSEGTTVCAQKDLSVGSRGSQKP